MRKKDWALQTALYAPEDKALPGFMRPEIKPRAKPRKLEEALQKTCVEWLNLQKDILFWHTPNSTWVGSGANQGARMGYLAKMKRLGVRSGVCDLLILRDGQLYGAELKAPGGRVSDEQTFFMEAATNQGAICGVVRDLDGLIELLAKN